VSDSPDQPAPFPPVPPPYGGSYGGMNYGAPTPSYPSAGFPALPAPPVHAAPPGQVFVPGLGWVRLATAGQRFGARLIDSIIMVVVVGALFLMALVPLFGMGAASSNGNDSYSGFFAGLSGLFVLAAIGALIIFGVLYEVAFVAIKGGTPGKLLLHIKIVNEQTGQVIGWGPSFLRWLIPTAANMVCSVLQLVVYLSFFWDADKRMQGWHDKVAKDLVIQVG